MTAAPVIKALSLLITAATVLLVGRPSTDLADAAQLVPGRVTIVGDSVTMDAKPNLLADIHGAVIHATLDEQWYQGVTYLRRLKASGRLGTVVVVALGTNGPITANSMSQMMQVLTACRRVVLVTNHVPLWWQDANNRRLKAAAARHANVVIADWESLAATHPRWFYPDGVHMPTGGSGARAFARLVASKI